MDLELSDDQVALRDGIASMLEARIPIERVRAGFDRAMFDELANAGVFSLRNDGFSWADCVVVFEQLGRYCVPGPLVDSLLLGDGRIAGITSDFPPIWIEHLDALDVLLVNRPGGTEAVDPATIEAEDIGRHQRFQRAGRGLMVRPDQECLPEIGDIEQAGMLARVLVLGDGAVRIFARYFIAGERHHAGAARTVQRVQRRDRDGREGLGLGHAGVRIRFPNPIKPRESTGVRTNRAARLHLAAGMLREMR